MGVVDSKKHIFINFNPVDIGFKGDKGIIANIILHHIRHTFMIWARVEWHCQAKH